VQLQDRICPLAEAVYSRVSEDGTVFDCFCTIASDFGVVFTAGLATGAGLDFRVTIGFTVVDAIVVVAANMANNKNFMPELPLSLECGLGRKPAPMLLSLQELESWRV